jgi:DNA gyrase subunit A
MSYRPRVGRVNDANRMAGAGAPNMARRAKNVPADSTSWLLFGPKDAFVRHAAGPPVRIDAVSGRWLPAPLVFAAMAADGVVPDACDGLTWGCRRALLALRVVADDGGYRPSAAVVDATLRMSRRDGRRRAIYGELVRMARPWELRHPLADGRGNLGSINGDDAGSADYTELRLAPIAAELLGDAHDGATAPAVLPARFPNLLVNGSFAVATGAASHIPPHNLREVAGAAIELLHDPEVDVDGLLAHIAGPDFPTGGIVAADGLRDAYATGRGAITVRARAHVEPGRRGGESIVVTEIPFMVATGGRGGVIADIARGVKSGRIAGIADISDFSDELAGLRIVLDLEHGADPGRTLAELYEHTQLQVTFELKLVAAAADGAERAMSLRDVLAQFVEHRRRAVPAGVIEDELLQIAERYGDERRTTIA